jgi:TATA element modulatory factor 1 DNA binding
MITYFPAGGNDGDWLGFDVLRSLAGVIEDATTVQQDSETLEEHKEEEAPLEIEEEVVSKKEERQSEDQMTVEKEPAPSSSTQVGLDDASATIENIENLENQRPTVQEEELFSLGMAATAAELPAAEEEQSSSSSNADAVIPEQEILTPELVITIEEAPRSVRDEAAATVAAGLGAAAAATSVSLPLSQGKPSEPLLDTPSSSSSQPLEPKKKRKGVDVVDSSKLGAKDLCALVLSLQESLTARESQLERQAQEAADAAAATAALLKKNEELVLSKAAVSEKDVEEMRKEFENRLTAAERKVATLTKERDALRKPKKGTINSEELLRQKDEEIRQIMEEGEALSKKQLTQETTMKQLRAKIKSLKEESESLISRLETEHTRSVSLEKDKEKMAADLAAAQERQVEQLAAERQHFERLLAEARTTAAVAEKKAEDAVKAGAARKLRDAEIKIEALEGTVEQLREELERKRAAADEREDLLSSEVAALQRRCVESEARLQELQSKLPEATAPLLQQLENMQVAAEYAAISAAETERALQNQFSMLKMKLKVLKLLLLRLKPVLLLQKNEFWQRKRSILLPELLLKKNIKSVSKQNR